MIRVDISIRLVIYRVAKARYQILDGVVSRSHFLWQSPIYSEVSIEGIPGQRDGEIQQSI